MDEFWVFGYGSLMWNPGFEHVERQVALVHGFHRALCVKSHVHRGTAERPGLVLGLDRGGACKGVAFRTDPEYRPAVTGYLRERELVTSVYIERLVTLRLGSGRKVTALTYVIDRSHFQYASGMHAEDAAAIVRGAVGKSGRNEDYVLNTLSHMREIGINDHWMEDVGRRIVSLP